MAKEKFERTKPHVNVQGSNPDPTGELTSAHTNDLPGLVELDYHQLARDLPRPIELQSDIRQFDLMSSEAFVPAEPVSQTMAVPEPSTGTLALAMGIVAWWYAGRKR